MVTMPYCEPSRSGFKTRSLGGGGGRGRGGSVGTWLLGLLLVQLSWLSDPLSPSSVDRKTCFACTMCPPAAAGDRCTKSSGDSCNIISICITAQSVDGVSILSCAYQLFPTLSCTQQRQHVSSSSHKDLFSLDFSNISQRANILVIN